MVLPASTNTSSKTSYIRPDSALAGYLVVDDHRAFLHDKKRLAALADAIATYAQERGATTFSWDVFDTALLREPKSEGRRFYTMAAAFAERMAQEDANPDFTAQDALLARAQAAQASYRMARPKHGNREGTLTEIATIACALLRCPEHVEIYIETEMRVEADSLTPNPLLPALAERLPDMKMMFVSDMYIEGPHIRGLVEGKLPSINIATLHSSADGLGSKRGGGIFANLEAETGLTGSEIVHLGDSLHSDFRMPRQNGWNSLYLPLPEAERDSRKACFAKLSTEMEQYNVSLGKYLHFNI